MNCVFAHEAVPAEDRMHAFLWRHLVPARDLKVLVFDPTCEPPPKRIAPARVAAFRGCRFGRLSSRSFL
ncbi:MAG: hypothetical protein AAB676_04775 [Verrucomicrobiota bacterium]